MAFKFKNMSLYIRNVIEPIIKASHMVQDSRIREIRKKFEEDLTKTRKEFQEKFETEVGELTTLVNTKLASTEKRLDTSTVPVGSILIWPFSKNPATMPYYLECNGQAITQAAYPDLYALVGARVPDLRGLFLRGYGGSSAALLTRQADVLRKPNDVAGTLTWASGLSDGAVATGAFSMSNTQKAHNWKGSDGRYTHPRTIELRLTGAWPANVLGTETRPVNMAVRYLIRAKP